MNIVPPSTYGWLTTTIRRLYQELHKAGYDHTYLIDLSLRKALLLRYPSPKAIDANLGEGVYQGIKSSHGDYAHWRKIWSRVIKEQKALQPIRLAALAGLRAQIDHCRNTGLSDVEINAAYYTQMSPLRSLQAS